MQIKSAPVNVTPQKSHTNGSGAATISRQMVKSLTGINGLLMAFRMQGGTKQSTPQAA
jgi:hypothetical protein